MTQESKVKSVEAVVDELMSSLYMPDNAAASRATRQLLIDTFTQRDKEIREEIATLVAQAGENDKTSQWRKLPKIPTNTPDTYQ